MSPFLILDLFWEVACHVGNDLLLNADIFKALPLSFVETVTRVRERVRDRVRVRVRVRPQSHRRPRG